MTDFTFTVSENVRKKYVSLYFFRDGVTSNEGTAAVVLGGLDEGQIPAVHKAEKEPDHGATHSGHIAKVIPQKCPPV